jgi:PAS domain S-box-containing protein
MSNSTLSSASKRLPEIASLIVVLIGGLVLAGWATDTVTLKSLRPTLPAMRPNAAVGLLLGGASLLLFTVRPLNGIARTIGRFCAVVVALLGLLSLIEHFFDLNSGVDRWLFGEKLEGVDGGKLPVSTALSFFLSAIALLTLHIETRRGSRPAQFLATGVSVICLLTLISYGYGMAGLYHLNPGMAIHTCIAFIVLSVGVLSAYPNRGLMAVATSRSAGGFMFRRLMLAAIGVPSILGWLNVAGADAKLYSREFGVPLLVASNVALFLIVIWRNAQLLHRIDADRQHVADALRRSNDELESRVESRTLELTEANEALRIEIAERRRVAEELHRSQEELSDFFENAAVGLHWAGPDGRILHVNRAELNMLGYEREEYVGHRISEFHADPKAVNEIMNHLARHETLVDYPAVLRAKDGSIRHVLINSNVLWEGDRFVHTRCLTRDITDAKRIEDERNQLLLSEQAARSQAEHATEAIRRLQTITDIALSTLSLDELLREMLGRIQDLLGADAAAILLVSEDGSSLAGRIAIGLEEEARVRVPMGRGIAGRIAVSRTPMIVDDISREEVVSSILIENVCSLVGAPLMIKDRVIGVIHVDTLKPHHFTDDDVNLLQLAADRVAMAIERARLYEGEQQARLESETANRMKDDFLATISHELRSPLNSILGWVMLLREGGLSPEATTRALQTVERSARMQNRIIGDLLDVSRIISGQLRLNVRTLEPASIIEAGVEAMRPAADAKGIFIKLSLDPRTGAITADPDRLQQIVWNLVSNAIKFTPKGGVVEVRLSRFGAHVELSVSDTGAGISPEFIPYVFERFRQADSSSTRKQGGLGLGLAIVRHLVELHGGTVHAESEGAGKGAAFVVRIPLTGLASQMDDERAHLVATLDSVTLDCPPPLEGLRVLVVDDEPSVLDLVSAILSKRDADVRTAASAAEALMILSDRVQWRPEVLITDIEMPDADGYELLRQVRTLPPESGGRVPAVALTAHARVEDRMKALAAGFQMHVPKPVEPAELLTVLGSVTGRLARSTGPLAPLRSAPAKRS